MGSILNPVPAKQEDEEEVPNSSTAALLTTKSSSSEDRSKLSTTTVIFISLVLSTCIALSAAAAFAYLFFYNSPNPTTNEVSRSLTELKNPVVLLISSDGFRFGYQYKTDLPNINRLIKNGTEAELGLIPVFPTLTFPNHYSIVTGLYPAYHGDYFTMHSHESKWWLGEPLWETVTNHGLKASTYFWPGSEVKKGSWNCPKDTVLSYFDLDSDDIPSFMTLYFEDPDHQGHQVGPDDPQITEAVIGIDKMIGKLIDGLEKRGIFEDVNVILVGDHGMVGTCDKKLIFLDDLAKWVELPKEWIQSYTPLLAIKPPNNYSTREIVTKMNEGLKSGDVGNGEYLRVYLKEELPTRLHYSASDRIPPIIGLIEEGFKVEQTRSKRQECGGAHGYDNAFFSMRTIFIAHGPRFGRGRKAPSFENVEIYNLVTKILDIEGAPNNGTSSFPQSVLLPNP
ncbi:hypothetical protein ACJIZ3_018779 [Penstemon smallii]|uniref:Uncharacterized protein n=1 Tax=Penstemon smallii TaxID=265156 RepID=A0ABD3SZD7_9LAMI